MTSAVLSKDREGNKKARIMAEQIRDYLEKPDALKSAGLDAFYPVVPSFSI